MLIFEGGLLIKMDEPETEVSTICKNCQHQMSMHLPNCKVLSNDRDSTKFCNLVNLNLIYQFLVNISAGRKFIVTVVEN